MGDKDGIGNGKGARKEGRGLGGQSGGLECAGQWTLTGMRRPLSTGQITDGLHGVDEGRALGLPNPGSSVFHVLRLPTMLSRISRRGLSANLKPARPTKGIRPGWQ